MLEFKLGVEVAIVIWNPWHGCRKLSPGCQNCYVFRQDEKLGKEANIVNKTGAYNLPIQKLRNGEFKIRKGSRVACCLTSDFFIEEADGWRAEAWSFMRQRKDLEFWLTTKRIDRFGVGLPADWADGYDNVTVACTVENQEQAEKRLPGYLALPIKHKNIICEPLLEPIDLWKFLNTEIEQVCAGGESGPNARVCDYLWVASLAQQCRVAGVSFSFHQTGARFRFSGNVFNIPRRCQHTQARAAGLDYAVKEPNLR